MPAVIVKLSISVLPLFLKVNLTLLAAATDKVASTDCKYIVLLGLNCFEPVIGAEKAPATIWWNTLCSDTLAQ